MEEKFEQIEDELEKILNKTREIQHVDSLFAAKEKAQIINITANLILFYIDDLRAEGGRE